MLYHECSWHTSPSVNPCCCPLVEQKVLWGKFRWLTYPRILCKEGCLKFIPIHTTWIPALIIPCWTIVLFPWQFLYFTSASLQTTSMWQLQWSSKNANLILLMASLKCFLSLLTDFLNSSPSSLRSIVLWGLPISFLIWQHCLPHGPGFKQMCFSVIPFFTHTSATLSSLSYFCLKLSSFFPCQFLFTYF